jgi:murein L,D-transpeptidase YcbB/YkuD
VAPVVAKTPPAGVTLYPGVSAESCKIGQATAPSWPNKSWTEGAYDKSLACWQMQMGARGYDLYGTGYYGANTKTAAQDIQKKNGLPGSGLIGPKTWKAAWEGTVS